MKMAIRGDLSSKKCFLVLALIFFVYEVEIVTKVVAHQKSSSPKAKGDSKSDSKSGSKGGAVFDVTEFDAKGNGKPDYTEDGENANSLAFIQAWQKACNNIAPSKLVIPKGTFVVAQVLFSGPCQTQVTVELQGNLKADPDPSVFPNNELVVFQQVEGAIFTGTGTIEVNQPAMPCYGPDKEFVFMEVMPSVKFSNATNCVVDGIHSLNPQNFHVLVQNSRNVSLVNTNFEATTPKPDTRSNAIYISGSSMVAITNSHIKTGDDCITVSGGSSDVSITGVTCVDGKGMSVGAQLDGAHPDYNVKGVKVKNCTFKGTQFGVKVNPRPTDKPGTVSNIIFEDLIMDGALNPISIKTDFATLADRTNIAKITDVHFKNIKGTTTTNAALSIACSKAIPCDGIEVVDVGLSLTGKSSIVGKVTSLLSATCLNAKVVFNGKNDGLKCA